MKLFFASPIDPATIDHLAHKHDVARLWDDEFGSLHEAAVGRQVIPNFVIVDAVQPIEAVVRDVVELVTSVATSQCAGEPGRGQE